jgi:putative SOS response-associated peptidase YedK
MCGRYTLTVDPESIYGAFGFDEPDADDAGGGRHAAPYGGDLARPRYNIAPTDQVPVVLDRSTEGDRRQPVRRLEAMRWGLIPAWAKDVSIGARQFNLRAETLDTKFRSALERRRCLLPASGFYEWQRIEGPAKGRGPAKQAYYLTPADGSLLALAGVWEFWRSPAGDPVRSAAIITVPAAGRMLQIHDRMPLMLPPDAWDTWLSLTGTAGSVAGLLAGSGADAVDALEFRPVGDRVGNVRNDDAELIDAVEPVVDLNGTPTGQTEVSARCASGSRESTAQQELFPADTAAAPNG